MRRTPQTSSRLGSAIDALCIAPLLLMAIATASDAWVEAISMLVNAAFDSD